MKKFKLDLKPKIKELEAVLKRRASYEPMAGKYLSAFKGKGLEFSEFRPYFPSDDASRIDWKASLRARKLLVRELIEERNLTVLFILDVSNSMLFGTTDKLKAEYAAEVVATLSLGVQTVGDMTGLIMFSEKVVKFIPPASERDQFFKIVEAISDPYLYGGNYDLERVLVFLMELKSLKQNEIIFIVSDFIGLKGNWKAKIKATASKFDLNLVIIRDPVDQELPNVDESLVLSSPFKDERAFIDTRKVRRSYKISSEKVIRDLKEQLLKTGSSHMLLVTDKPYKGEIIKFFKWRARK